MMSSESSLQAVLFPKTRTLNCMQMQPEGWTPNSNDCYIFYFICSIIIICCELHTNLLK